MASLSQAAGGFRGFAVVGVPQAMGSVFVGLSLVLSLDFGATPLGIPGFADV